MNIPKVAIIKIRVIPRSHEINIKVYLMVYVIGPTSRVATKPVINRVSEKLAIVDPMVEEYL